MHNSDMDMPHAYKYHMYATSRSTRADPDATYSKLPLQEKIATLSGQTKTELVAILKAWSCMYAVQLELQF